MGNMKFCAMAVAIASIYPAARAADNPGAGGAAAAATNAGAATAAPASPVATGATASTPDQLGTVQITGKRLDQARNQLSPDTGSSIYRFSKSDIEALPLGSATPLNQVLLQAPGVVQDSYGGLHVRGDHGNLQYRINNVVIPEAISGFGQSLDTRLAGSVSMLTGALPAQYGYRTAGVIDIQTKNPPEGTAGSVSLVGGTRGHGELSGDVSGSNEGWSYFFTGSMLQDDVGIENPTAARNALHDDSKQLKAFGTVSRQIDDNSRISFMAGSSNNRFEIPNVPGQTPAFTLDNAPPVNSATLDARQRERNSFQVISYQNSPSDQLDYQISLSHRYTDVRYQPDPVGDLVYDGIAAQILRKNDAVGLQGDMSYRLGERHTLRAGLFLQHERFNVDNTSSVFPADAQGRQTSGVPISIVDNTRLRGGLYGVYLQDEWQPTKALTINYGARFDKADTVVNEKQFSPRLGLVYDLSPATRLHAGYARYFTPPPTEKIDTTSIAKFQGTTNALPSDANTAVSSERSNYFDIGLTHRLSPQITLGLDAYYRQIRHLQDEGQFGNALIYSAFNYDRGRIGGVELSAAYRDRKFSAYANVAFSQARGKGIESGQFNFPQDELDYIATHWVHLDHEQTVSGSAGMSYEWGQSKLGADLIYGSGLRSGFANTEHLPSYAQVNASVARPLELGPMGRIEGRVSVINLFDRVYQIRDGSGIGVGAPQYGARRGLYLALTKNF